MARFRVFLLTLGCCWGLLSSVHAQGPAWTSDFAHQSENDEGEPVRTDTQKKVYYIVYSSKCCRKCFPDLCAAIARRDSSPHVVYVVPLGTIGPLARLTLMSTLTEIMPGISKVLFQQREDARFGIMQEQPTPQMIIQDEKKLRYQNYAEVIEFIGK